MANPEFADLPWVPPRSYSAGRPEGPPRFVTIHYTAGHEGWTNAENGASYDQRRTDGTSSHFYVDADSVVQCVATWDRSHTALYHGNLWGIHFELCGTVQTREQWLDDVSRRTIANTARIAARCMTKWRIPLVRIVGTGVRSLTARGVCGHYDWTIGWPEDNGDHTDPGPQFPWDVLFADIQKALSGGDDDMSIEDSTRIKSAEAHAWAIRNGVSPIAYINGNPDLPINVGNPLWDMLRAIAKAAGTDADELAAIEAAAKRGAEAGVAAQADEFVAAVLAGLPDAALTRADVEAALRSVLGSLDQA